MSGFTAMRSIALSCLALGAACTPVAPSVFAVAETELEIGGLARGVPARESLPAIEVRRADGTPLAREDWLAAEDAARTHCAGQDAVFEPLPAARDYTQVRLDDGVFLFMAVCRR